MHGLLQKGTIPYAHDLENSKDDDNVESEFPHLMGMAATVITEVKPVKEIIEEFTRDAITSLQRGAGYIQKL